MVLAGQLHAMVELRDEGSSLVPPKSEVESYLAH
jgi:hypothetical protein